MTKSRQKNIKGNSLLEILVVITVFAALAVMVTQSIFLTLRGSRKSEFTTRVREDLDHSLLVIERNLRNAEEIDVSSCLGDRVDYTDELGKSTFFACLESSGIGYIASGSARLTGEDIDVFFCQFSCDNTTSPPSVNVSLKAQSIEGKGAEGAKVSVSTKIYLRDY